MNQLYIINGSPKGGNQNNSQYFIDEFLKLFPSNDWTIKQESSLRCSREKVYPEMMKSDAILFAFPLYIDCLHGSLLRFLIELEKYIKENKSLSNSLPRVYAIANCGFFEGRQNRIALDILKNFCNRTGLLWRFGVGIGAGEFMGGSRNIPLKSKVKKDTFDALMVLKEDVENPKKESQNNIFTSPKIPRLMFQIVGSLGWIQQAKGNKISFRKMYAKPLRKA